MIETTKLQVRRWWSICLKLYIPHQRKIVHQTAEMMCPWQAKSLAYMCRLDSHCIHTTSSQSITSSFALSSPEAALHALSHSSKNSQVLAQPTCVGLYCPCTHTHQLTHKLKCNGYTDILTYLHQEGINIHTYIQTYIHTSRAHWHTYIHIYLYQECVHTYIKSALTYIHTYIHTQDLKTFKM